MVKRRLVGGVILGLLLNFNVIAEPPTTAVIGTPPQPTWSVLNPQQKNILAPLAEHWDKMENIGRKKWLGIADRYPNMSTDEQRRVQERMREWASLTPAQRNQVRGTYKDFKQLPPEQKQVVKQKWEAYNSLPAEEKQRIRESGKSVKLLPPPPLAETPTSASPNSTATSPQPNTDHTAAPESGKP